MDHEHLLHDKPSIKLNIAGDGQRGVIWLCSIYGCYDHLSELDLSRVDVAEFVCPHCNQLLSTRSTCDKCGAPLVSFALAGGGKVNICSRKGCTEHFLAFEDIGDSMRNFYEVYGF
jgi:hypothetical protein